MQGVARRGLGFAAVLATILAACGALIAPTPPNDVVVMAAEAQPSMRLTCDGSLSFAPDALRAATGEEREQGPLASGLRAAIGQFDVASFPGARQATWLLANQVEDEAIFLARAVGDPTGPAWLFAALSRSGGSWDVADVGGCAPVVLIADGVRTGTWVLDPKFDVGGLGVQRVAVLFDDITCSQGSTVGLGRAAAMALPTGETGLVIGASEQPGTWNCPGKPPVQVWVTLPALGGGNLRDLGRPGAAEELFAAAR